MDDGVYSLVLVKTDERFIFIFEPKQIPQLLQRFGEYAAEPDLNFTWTDANILSERARKIAQRHK